VNPPSASTPRPDRTPQPLDRRISWGRLVTALVSVALTAAVFHYLFRHISIDEVVSAVTGASPRLLALFAFLSLTTSTLRLLQYRLLLTFAGCRVSSPALFLVVLARNACSDLLPARLGTLVYVFLVTTRLRVPLETAGSSFALATLFDTIGIVPLMLIAAALAGSTVIPPLLLWAGAAFVLTVSIIAIIALPHLLGIAARIATRSPRLARLGDLALRTAGEINRVRAAGLYLHLLVLSTLVRTGKYLGLYALLLAIVVPLGYTAAEMPFIRVFLGMCAAETSASLPISGIAGFGAYQGAWSLTFKLLGYPDNLAALTSLSHHLMSQAWGYSLGAVALLLLLLPLFRQDSPPRS